MSGECNLGAEIRACLGVPFVVGPSFSEGVLPLQSERRHVELSTRARSVDAVESIPFRIIYDHTGYRDTALGFPRLLHLFKPNLELS